MAQKDPSRTEQATRKRLNKARNKGNVAKSQEVSKAVTTFAGLVAITFMLGVLNEHMQEVFRFFLSRPHDFIPNEQMVYSLLLWSAGELAIMLLPIMLFIGLTAFIAMRLQVGKLWTTEVFKLDWSRFNVINALKRMFISPQTLIRLGKSLLQAVFIGIAPIIVLKQEMLNLLPLYFADMTGIAAYMLETGARMVKYALVPMVIIAVVDLWYTRWDYNENLKMTKDEVKDERKQAEGDPVVKSQQRQKMMKVMAQRMLKEVPTADVVITNPTHIAVALRYDVTAAPAPMVVAMGADHLAKRIREVAREHNVPIRENKPLARALYKSVEVGDMIPAELYKAVAAILAGLAKFRPQARGV